MMKRILYLTLGALMCVVSPAVGQDLFPDAPEVLRPDGRQKIKPSTFNFLKVSTNARVAGMADAFTAVADGMDGIIWNPAGVAKIQRFGYSFGYSRWLVDSEFFSGAVAARTPLGVFGLSVVSFQLPTIKETTTLSPSGTGRNVDVGDLAIGGVFAKQLTDKLGVGASVRYVQSKLGAETLKAMSFNVSTLMYTGFRSLRIGMNMKNLGGEQQIVSEKSEMPLVFHVGSAMEVYGDMGDPVSLTAAFEGAYFTDREQRWNLGGEMWVQNMLAVRAGYKFQYDEETWSVGAGAKGSFGGRDIRVDFSYTDFGELLNSPVRFSLSGSF